MSNDKKDERVERQFLVQQVKFKAKKYSAKPVFLVFSTKHLMIFSANNFQFQSAISFAEIKEVSVDKSERGLFALENLPSLKPKYFIADKKGYLDAIIGAFEIARQKAKKLDSSLPSLLMKRGDLLASSEVQEEEVADVSVHCFSISYIKDFVICGCIKRFGAIWLLSS